ncbi:hypothetical protein EJ377_02910 [Chryseobacterium arthrosphaerae]|uniref:Uncharacterized protein n=1 Tax=Chryseobacterium arthrosphaerae TaxID=651561 RepID=A0A432DZ66_9FLAO|nr:hypothetical protein EJ377_02910 [Chryseobacterium arthrosphaerae]
MQTGLPHTRLSYCKGVLALTEMSWHLPREAGMILGSHAMTRPNGDLADPLLVRFNKILVQSLVQLKFTAVMILR